MPAGPHSGYRSEDPPRAHLRVISENQCQGAVSIAGWRRMHRDVRSIVLSGLRDLRTVLI